MSKQARKLRRIISLLLAAVMAVSCFSVSAAASEESGAEGALPPPRYFYFTNNQGWKDVYVYAWDKYGNELCGEWPGTPMSISATFYDDPDLLEFCSVGPFETVGMIFNSGYDGDRTIEIEIDKNNIYSMGFYAAGERDKYGHLVVKYWENQYFEEIRLINTRNWEKVYVYAWEWNGNSLYGKWPGKELTQMTTDDYGDEAYKYFVPNNAKGIIFSNGENERTVDINGLSESNYYVLNTTDESGHFFVDLLSDKGDCYGDVDLNGKITIADATKISLYLAHLNGSYLSYLQEALADVNSDGVVSIADVTSIQFMLAELSAESRIGNKCYMLPELLNHYSEDIYSFADFDRPDDWNFVYMCAWDKNGNPIFGDWPGILLCDSYSEEYTIPLYKNCASFVLNDGGKRVTQKITDMPAHNINGMNYVLTGEKDEQGRYILQDEVYLVDEKDSRSIFFTNNLGWDKVYCYWWNETEDNGWPGVRMARVENNDFGDEQYKIVVPNNITNLIFGDGNGRQTVELEYDPEAIGWYICGLDNDGKAHCATW